MKIYIVRHSEAYDVGEEGIEKDEDRFLTKRGRKLSARVGVLLGRLGARPECVWTSPLVRATQTAERLCRKLKPSPPIVECTALAPPGKAGELLKNLETQGLAEVVLVGHEPFLGQLLAQLALGEGGYTIPISKSAAVCVETPADGAGPAKLVWLIGPDLMKAVSK